MPTKAAGSQREHLFLVSTIGQIRNAHATINAQDLPNAYLVMLHTRQNPTLSVRMKDYAAGLGLQGELVEIPRHPTLRLPWRLRKIMRTYQALLPRFPKAALWIANSNNHYGYVAHLFASHGRQVNAFEEGMSTYLTTDDPRFRKAPNPRIGETFKLMIASLRQKGRSHHLRVLRAMRFGYLYVNDTWFGEMLQYFFTNGQAIHFYTHWSDFDRVVVTFPELLDPRRFQAKSIHPLDPVYFLKADATTTKIDGKVLENIDNKSDSFDTIFVSQAYGFDANVWAENLAKTLSEAGISSLLFKSHPREGEENRLKIIAALRDCGVHVVADDMLDQIPIEDLSDKLQLKRIVGLTSTALLNIALSTPSNHVCSIAPTMLSHLLSVKGTHPEQHDILTRDTDLLRRISTAARADITFC